MDEVLSNIHIACGTVVDYFFYFSSINSNGLFRMDMHSGETEFIQQFIDEDILSFYIHKYCVKYNHVLYFIPYNSRNIHIYDLESGNQEKLGLYTKRKGWEAVYGIICINESLYIFSEVISPYAVVNLKDKSVKYCTRFYEWLKNNGANEEIGQIYRIAQRGNTVSFALRGTSLVFTWDLESEQGEVFDTGIYDLYGVEIGNDGFLMTRQYKYDLYSLNNSHIEPVFHLEDSCRSGRPFIRVIKTDDFVLAIPADKDFFLASKEDYSFWQVKYRVGDGFGTATSFGKNGYFVCGNTVYLFGDDECSVLEANLDNFEFFLQKARMKKNMYYFRWKWKLMQAQGEKPRVLTERGNFKLADYLNILRK